jgi:hypothetical protein
VNAAGWQGDVHTILHPVLSYRAARAFFRGQQSELPLALTPAATAIGAKTSLLQSLRRRSGGTLPDNVHRQLVEEACKTRPWMCATLFAQWYAEIEASPDREQLLADQLKKPPFRRHLTPQVIQSLIPLIHPDLAATEPVDARDADRLSELFVDYYFYGAPFSREALVSIWRRCEDGGGKSCQEERASIERRVGSLGPAAVARSAPRPE